MGWWNEPPTETKPIYVHVVPDTSYLIWKENSNQKPVPALQNTIFPVRLCFLTETYYPYFRVPKKSADAYFGVSYSSRGKSLKHLAYEISNFSKRFLGWAYEISDFLEGYPEISNE